MIPEKLILVSIHRFFFNVILILSSLFIWLYWHFLIVKRPIYIYQIQIVTINLMIIILYTLQVMVWKEMEYGCMSESEKQMLVSEVNLLRELKHQHIVRYYDRIIDRSRAIIYIIMEYCQGGDLASIISRNRKEGWVLVRA